MNISNSLSRVLNSIQSSPSEHTVIQTFWYPVIILCCGLCILVYIVTKDGREDEMSTILVYAMVILDN